MLLTIALIALGFVAGVLVVGAIESHGLMLLSCEDHRILQERGLAHDSQ